VLVARLERLAGHSKVGVAAAVKLAQQAMVAQAAQQVEGAAAAHLQ